MIYFQATLNIRIVPLMRVGDKAVHCLQKGEALGVWSVFKITKNYFHIEVWCD